MLDIGIVYIFDCTTVTVSTTSRIGAFGTIEVKLQKWPN